MLSKRDISITASSRKNDIRMHTGQPKAGKSAGSLGGATTIAGVENMTVKAKIALKEIIKRNRAMFAGIGIFALLFLVIAVSLGSCSASIEGAGSVIGITTYPSSDEDIYAAEINMLPIEVP